jgi:hypothetical protein
MVGRDKSGRQLGRVQNTRHRLTQAISALRQPLSRSILLFMALALSALALSCGGSDESDDVREAAEPAILGEAGESLRSITAPGYAELQVSKPRLEGMEVAEERAGRRVTGRVQATIKLKPKPDKASFLRVLPAEGATRTVTRRVSASLFRDDRQNWQMIPDSVQVSEAPAPAPSTDEQEQARKRAVQAVTSLLTWDGDVDAYNRAQAEFYATKPASAADFNQPGFDPAPALRLESKAENTDSFSATDVPVGAAWERTNDGGRDDLALKDVLKDTEIDCERFVLKRLEPKTVSGQPDESEEGTYSGSEGGMSGDELEQRVTITGQAVLTAGNWQSRSPFSSCGDERTGDRERTATAGSREIVVEYTAAVSRLLETRSGWFITDLDVRSTTEASLPQPGSGPYTLVGPDQTVP